MCVYIYMQTNQEQSKRSVISLSIRLGISLRLEPDIMVDSQLTAYFKLGLILFYYPPKVSIMKYCCLGIFRKEYFRPDLIIGIVG